MVVTNGKPVADFEPWVILLVGLVLVIGDGAPTAALMR